MPQHAVWLTAVQWQRLLLLMSGTRAVTSHDVQLLQNVEGQIRGIVQSVPVEELRQKGV